MIVVGALLVVAGVVTAVVGGGQTAGGWLLPVALVAAGAGAVIAGAVAAVRRRLAPLRAAARARRGTGSTTPVGGPLRRIRAVPAMVAGSWRGERAAPPRYQLALWLLAVVYVVSPIDFIPDFLPLLGFGDDIGVGAWLLTGLYAEAGNYLAQREETEV
ncbi:YkvA family protein [Saccharopolyspora rosea]|uniref:YkvA family protein n=1 Tax=Saccharopolyspora rosea TaxID=524884 RepID=A0ABW3FVF9_9PSEU|nr:DUF1232 domain-containing protein [Saccharopolyspora rosea]